MKRNLLCIPMFLILACCSSKMNHKMAIRSTEAPMEKDFLAEWDADTLRRADTAKNYSYLSQDEKKVIFYMNLARINGPLFAKTILDKHLNGKENKWSASLRRDLQKTIGVTPLSPQQDLFSKAKAHSRDMGKTGMIGHNSSTGISFSKRIDNLPRKYSRVAENCCYGDKDAIAIVVALLVDENVASLLHRKNTLNPAHKYAGPALQPHRKYTKNCTILFGGSKKSTMLAKAD